MTVKEFSESAGLSEPAIALATEESTPSTYLDALEKNELYQDAIRFLAFSLPVDNGIKWAIACIKELRSPESKDKKDEALDAADQWVKAPGDPTRWAAKEAADKSKPSASMMTAMAIFMSGGSMVKPPAPETPPPKNVAQKMISGSVQVAAVSYDPPHLKERYKKAIAMGKKPIPAA
jgi:hypothetical protein